MDKGGQIAAKAFFSVNKDGHHLVKNQVLYLKATSYYIFIFTVGRMAKTTRQRGINSISLYFAGLIMIYGIQ